MGNPTSKDGWGGQHLHGCDDNVHRQLEELYKDALGYLTEHNRWKDMLTKLYDEKLRPFINSLPRKCCVSKVHTVSRLSYDEEMRLPVFGTPRTMPT